MYQTTINVTPSKFWAIANKILRRQTYWTIAYNSVNNVGDDWFDDDYQTSDDAEKSANDYFRFESEEAMYEDGLKSIKRKMPITLAKFYLFNGERRYIEAIEKTLEVEIYRD